LRGCLASRREQYSTAADGALEINHARTIGGSPPAPLCALTVPANRNRFYAAALYGAFALIAAVIFGTLSVHPF
jgi:hypothetical protein